jgi:hypothetical protein
MVRRLRFLAAWLLMRRGLNNIQSDWHAWDIGWTAGRCQSLKSGSAEKQALVPLPSHRFLLTL